MRSKPRCGYLPSIQVVSTKLTCFEIKEVLNRTLAPWFLSVVSRTMTARAGLHCKYKREANEYDKDSMKMYDEGLNTTLIFVGERFVSHVERI